MFSDGPPPAAVFQPAIRSLHAELMQQLRPRGRVVPPPGGPGRQGQGPQHHVHRQECQTTVLVRKDALYVSSKFVN